MSSCPCPRRRRGDPPRYVATGPDLGSPTCAVELPDALDRAIARAKFFGSSAVHALGIPGLIPQFRMRWVAGELYLEDARVRL